MKNIKLFLLLSAMAFTQVTWAQTATLDYGRDANASPTDKVESANEAATTIQKDVFKGSDLDIADPQAQQNAKSNEDDTYYPVDLEILSEEINVSAGTRQVVERVNLLSAQVEGLLLANEELRRENELIRKSLNNCCSAAAAGLTADDAYLLQNAPNPLYDNTEVRFYIPDGLSNARLDITDLKGIVVQTFDLEATGLNSMKLDAQSLESGSYVYSLYVDGKIVDSRIMVITK